MKVNVLFFSVKIEKKNIKEHRDVGGKIIFKVSYASYPYNSTENVNFIRSH